MVRNLAEEYCGALLVQGYNAINVASHRRYLDRFIAHVYSEGRDILCTERNTPGSVDHGCLLRWMQAIRLTGVKEFSLQANKTAASGFFKWLIRLGKHEWNPIEMLPAIKLPKYMPKPLPVRDTEKILDRAPTLDGAHKERNRAMLEVFYASGIRNMELRHLDLEDLRLDEPEPFILVRQGKGGQDGIGMLTPPAVDAIRAYLPIREKMARRWELPPRNQPLFLSRSGKRMDPQSVWGIIGKIGEQVLGRHITPHQFRHSFCTDLMNRGADLMSIKELARHKQLTTTQKYLAVSTERLKEQYAKHPRSKKHKDP